MYILGISAYYHDSAAALLKDGEVIAAAQEERFSRIKNDPSFPPQGNSFCLQEAGITLSTIDIVVFYDKPFMKFERILETFYRHAPLGFRPFLERYSHMDQRENVFKQMLRKELRTLGRYDETHTRLLFTEHHLAHAASAFFASPYEKAAILTVDGVGEWATLSLSLGEGNKIEVLKEMHFRIQSDCFTLLLPITWDLCKLRRIQINGISPIRRPVLRNDITVCRTDKRTPGTYPPGWFDHFESSLFQLSDRL